MIMDALEASEHGKAEKAVRINAVGSGENENVDIILSDGTSNTFVTYPRAGA